MMKRFALVPALLVAVVLLSAATASAMPGARPRSRAAGRTSP
jgi:predicted small secreted protein